MVYNNSYGEVYKADVIWLQGIVTGGLLTYGPANTIMTVVGDAAQYVAVGFFNNDTMPDVVVAIGVSK